MSTLVHIRAMHMVLYPMRGMGVAGERYCSQWKNMLRSVLGVTILHLDFVRSEEIRK